ncbi:MAG: thiamine pyrophosphate-binding protein [SAR324 cluster bacterium]|nr:thiamine pyrophosphate-binding protein [SAR324 cluster bacterium]
MAWAEQIVGVLKQYRVKFINYVPDAKGEQILKVARKDEYFQILPLAREEEGIGVVCGQAIGGERGVVLMPTAGLGNSINALASLAIPYKFSLPMIIGVRGDLGEFNQAQIPMGQALPGILSALNIPMFRITRDDEVEKMTEGALRVSYANESPVAILVTNELAGWKKGSVKL